MGQLQGRFGKFKEGAPSPIDAPSELILGFIRERLVPGTILEVGGGNGAYSLGLRKAGLDSVVADINDDYLAVARKAGLQTLLLDPARPLQAKSWDNVVLVEVLEHLPDPSRLLADACRAARGKVIFTVPRSEDFDELFKLRLSYNHMVVTDHLHHFGEAEMTELVSPWAENTEIRRDEPIHPHCTWGAIRTSFRSKFLCEVCILPLRLAGKLGWMRPIWNSRFLVCIDVSRELEAGG